MKKFNIPPYYRSSFISKIKEKRRDFDPRKKDYTPSALDYGKFKFYLARHFGFCYGVENAIEIAYNTIDENPDKRVFLLSEMIHNPGVNEDLLDRGVQFLMDTSGQPVFNWDELTKEDIVIIPAFGTTIEIQEKLDKIGIDPYTYNTTCPFVEKVWNRSYQLGDENFTVIVHGKYYHEETKATFSHAVKKAPVVIIRNIEEAELLSQIILGEKQPEYFYEFFKGKYSEGFDVSKDLNRLGVVNQTTMLAAETQTISDLIKNTMIKKYGYDNVNDHYADTRDTLCYATNDNQEATYGLLEQPADFAIVVGGYNSSNTSHIVELCEEKIKTYFISSADKIISDSEINHFDIRLKKEITTKNFLPNKSTVEILLTSGASCPDSVIDKIIRKILSFDEIDISRFDDPM